MLNHNKIFLLKKNENEREEREERSEREDEYGLGPGTVVQFYMDSEVDGGNGQ